LAAIDRTLLFRRDTANDQKRRYLAVGARLRQGPVFQTKPKFKPRHFSGHQVFDKRVRQRRGRLGQAQPRRVANCGRIDTKKAIIAVYNPRNNPD
jgi:hypothetical protein